MFLVWTAAKSKNANNSASAAYKDNYMHISTLSTFSILLMNYTHALHCIPVHNKTCHLPSTLTSLWVVNSVQSAKCLWSENCNTHWDRCGSCHPSDRRSEHKGHSSLHHLILGVSVCLSTWVCRYKARMIDCCLNLSVARTNLSTHHGWLGYDWVQHYWKLSHLHFTWYFSTIFISNSQLQVSRNAFLWHQCFHPSLFPN